MFDGKSYTVVGIAPAGFRLDGRRSRCIHSAGPKHHAGACRIARRIRVGVDRARLRAGATLSTGAERELAVIGASLAAQYPEIQQRTARFIAEPLRPDVGDVRSTLWLLLGAVSLVLLIACVNVASLLLARAVSRERELAMRVALGAGRGRLVRQCLTESAVLGLAGGALGVVLAAVGRPPVRGVLARQIAARRRGPAGLARVAVRAVGVSLLSGLLFGLAPALRAPARGLEQALRAGARTVTGSSRRLHGGFVISEIALAVVLLVSAGMLGRTLLRLSSLDPGVNVHNVLIARMALSPATLANPAQDPRGLAGNPGSRAPRARSGSDRDGRYGPDARRQQPDRLLDHAGRRRRRRQPLTSWPTA